MVGFLHFSASETAKMLHPLSTAPNTSHPTARQRALHSEARKAHAELERALSALEQVERCCGDVRATLPAWTPVAERAALIELEAQVATAGALVDDLLVQTISRYGELLELAPAWVEVHGELADLYWRLLGRAEERGDASAAERYLSLLTVHDDGRYVDLIEGTATLELDTDPEGAEVELITLETVDGLTRRAATRQLGTTPLPPTDLAPGNYLLELRHEGHAPTRRPLVLRRGSDVKLHVTLFRSREIGADFVYVPAGRFRKGGAAAGAPATRQAFVDNFAMARLPVTVGEYMLFIDDLADSDPGRAIAFASRQEVGALADPRLPVTGISYAAAEAYARWLSRRSGVSYRLPHEDEWEKAARGVDGRSFVWGERFEATFCAMRDTRPGEAHAVPVGSHPEDLSIYGARDLAGGVAEWTQDAFAVGHADQQVVRGGSFEEGPEACQIARRQPMPRSATARHVGFRLVRELAGGGGEIVTAPMVPELDPELLELRIGPEREPIDLDEARRELLDECSKLASADDPKTRTSGLLALAVGLLRAERGFWLRPPTDADETATHQQGDERDGAVGLHVLAGCSAVGEPLPLTDQQTDEELARAVVQQRRAIRLRGSRRLAVPVPRSESCLVFERRFSRVPFGEREQLVAEIAADLLALALRLADARHA